ncbi:glycoside hydrolase family 3 N-terminal domain-containing protein [Stigmatella sp. ncwal1]|uniref:Glycoside hydrolase family 3 N-terminal domain-containing protein n=1 Tax=Stigmatella ashevillensis TaxID=2995309 RepID=A0ABT5DJ22_9BACT|nr:glycoside hydrolase family 3 protein [Stigmatella ashevillena]MDC0713652.1 glycoside hydrolase family 3 N-terminal domain-containing protein [Stigmatella ashevillena]
MKRPFVWQRFSSGAALALLWLSACHPEEVGEQALAPPALSGEATPLMGTAALAWPKVQSAIAVDAALEAKVEALLASMTLEEKVGQMMQVEIGNVTPAEIKQYHLGSVLNGGGSFPGGRKNASVQDWVTLADQLWEASMDPSKARRIPIIWGTDAVHGHNNVRGATFFPHNIGLGAANDPELIRRIGEVTAREVARTGVDWAFAPTIAVVRDDRWGRTYEGYSEDPALVEAYAGKAVQGFQGLLGKDAKSSEKVIATAKHFLGDGGTTRGVDQGVTSVTEQDLRDLHGKGYFTALGAGAQTVMASFNSWQDKALGANAKAFKMHGNKYLLTEVLKNQIGFDGFVISDWNGHGQINRNNSDSATDCTNGNCPQAINAGIDMVMVPYRDDWKALITNTLASVRNGQIPESRINDAVRRILRVKYRAGLFEKPKPSLRNTSREVGSADHRAVAREAVRKSLVLLKNNGSTLPLSRSAKILVAGKSANSLQNQNGGWSLTWQGTGNSNADFGGGVTAWQAIQKIVPTATLDTSTNGALADSSYAAAVVVIGETPYAEGVGDLSGTTLELAKLRPEDLALIDSLKAKGVKKIVTVLFSGRPLYANKEINRSDAFVAAWLPGTEGDGLADVLFRNAAGAVNYDFTGKLSYSWPKSPCQVQVNQGNPAYAPLYAYGYGLTYASGQEQGQHAETTQGGDCGDSGDGGGGGGTTSLVMFNRGNQNGWVMRVGAPSNWNGIAVAQSTSTTTSTAGSELSATPVDDRNGLQWAAVKATWNNATAEIYMQNSTQSEVKNLQTYLSSGGALVFDARVSTKPSGAVKARVDCVYPCAGEIDITPALNALPVNTWTELAIPLQCFSAKGTDFTRINTSVLLYTQGTLELSLASIRWEPSRAANVSCEGNLGAPGQLFADKDVYVNGVYDTALFSGPSVWKSGSGSATLSPAFNTGTETVIDAVFNNLTEGGGNGVVSFPVKDPLFLDVSAIAATGGVQFDIKVLNYGGTTQNFWAKIVCDRNPNQCATGDLKTLIGRPAVNTWKTVKIPFTSTGYPATWKTDRLSSAVEVLPAWDDQRGTIRFQLRNIRILKQLN